MIILVVSYASLYILKDHEKMQTQKVNIIIRFDDCAIYKDTLYNENLFINNNKSNMELVEIFLKHMIDNKVKISVGIIPFSNNKNDIAVLNDNLVSLLKEGLEKNLIEICLHGFEHLNNAKSFAPSEFSRIPIEIQDHWIKKGKERIANIFHYDTGVFIPPFNAWDYNTIQALKNNHISILSAEADTYPQENMIVYFPYTTIPKDLNNLLSLNLFDKNPIVVVVVIHPHDLTKKNNYIGLERILNIVDNLVLKYKNYNLLSFQDAYKNSLIFQGEVLQYYKELFGWIQFWQGIPLYNKIVYTNSLSAYRPNYNRYYLHTLRMVFCCSFAFLGMFFCIDIISCINNLKYIIKIIIVIMLALFTIYIIYGSLRYMQYSQVINFKRIGILSFVVGNWVGYFMDFSKKKRRRLI